MTIKTYVVLERLGLVSPNGANVIVVGVRLTREAAQRLADECAGRFVTKELATK